jgi:hypothetical protein
MRSLISLVVVSAVVALVSGAAGHAAGGLACGDLVTTSVTLTADLSGCGGDGLTVQGDNITVDLNGHALSGSGQGTGITVTGSRNTFTDGTVSGFDMGLASTGPGVTLRALAVTGNARDGVSVRGCQLQGATVEHTASSGNGHWGYYFQNCSNLTVSKSHALRNGNTGLFLDFNAGSNIHIDEVTASFNGGAGMAFSARGSVVSSSTFRGNVAAGVTTSGHADGDAYLNNDFSDNGGNGLHMGDSYSIVTGNTANRNALNGIHQTECCAQPGLNVMTANSADNNGAAGIAACVEIRNGTNCGPGIDDGGGNSAKHNGGPQQCLNIVCAVNRGRAKDMPIQIPVAHPSDPTSLDAAQPTAYRRAS